MAVAASGGHFEHPRSLYPSSNLHHPLITNKPVLFRATNRLPMKTTLGTLRNMGLTPSKQYTFVIFTLNNTR